MQRNRVLTNEDFYNFKVDKIIDQVLDEQCSSLNYMHEYDRLAKQLNHYSFINKMEFYPDGEKSFDMTFNKLKMHLRADIFATIARFFMEG
jgi:hypothetical protein